MARPVPGRVPRCESAGRANIESARLLGFVPEPGHLAAYRVVGSSGGVSMSELNDNELQAQLLLLRRMYERGRISEDELHKLIE